MNMPHALTRFGLILLITQLHACVVVPKKVASYDSACKVALQKITLDVEHMESDTQWHCTNDNCAWDISAEIAEAVFTTATSAVVAGSIALVGNTVYWLESEGNCPHKNPHEAQEPATSPLKTPPIETDDRFLIEEEIISAKS